MHSPQPDATDDSDEETDGEHGNGTSLVPP